MWWILDSDAIKPWRYKYWICMRASGEARPLDPRTASSVSTKRPASRHASVAIHSFHQRRADQPVLSTNTSAAVRCGIWLLGSSPRPLMGRGEEKTRMASFGRLKLVLSEETYRSAERLSWVVDNDSAHRGEAGKKRLHQVDPRINLVHTPVHARWLTQVEINFSIIQRKVRSPDAFADTGAIRPPLALYEELSNQSPAPFKWKFGRTKLNTLPSKIEARYKLLNDAQTLLSAGEGSFSMTLFVKRLT